jgi:hypothetical protein
MEINTLLMIGGALLLLKKKPTAAPPASGNPYAAPTEPAPEPAPTTPHAGRPNMGIGRPGAPSDYANRPRPEPIGKVVIGIDGASFAEGQAPSSGEAPGGGEGGA